MSIQGKRQVKKQPKIPKPANNNSFV